MYIIYMQCWVAKFFVRLICRHPEKQYTSASVHMCVCLFAAKTPGARHRSTLVRGEEVKFCIPLLPRETIGPKALFDKVQ